ncbi:MAG: GMC family oxidoreductase [Acidobacteria bacterium]|nr:MAG: GMC family oxidoreductase [Acidobacteriota bacterium]REK08342.1 MAG: GMC family oxidoreductase [Acidobacteriota bacterium]
MAGRVHETGVCILGSGITGALVAERLAEQTTARITVVEAGDRIFNLDQRFERRDRFLDYRENPWPDDHIRGQTGRGLQSRSMCVGGLGLHWGGTTPRFTPEDLRLRSLYGVGEDWPVEWEELDAFYQEAEERIGIAGVQGPPELDPRSRDYPMPALPLSYNLEKLRAWGERSGIPFWPNPVSKNSRPYRGRNVCVRCDTCTICPTGAKYSPDFTLQELLARERIELLDRTLVRRLVVGERGRIAGAKALDRDRPDEPLELRADVFVVALGYAWSAHLLLLSASDRAPAGVANRSGLVGRFMSGHRPYNAFVEVPEKLYPGIYEMDSLLSKSFQRPGDIDRYVRHDLRIWESDFGRRPRLRSDDGELLLGEDLLADWRQRGERGAARLRAYYDVIPAEGSGLRIDTSRTNEWGDPMFRIEMQPAPETSELIPLAEAQIEGVFDRMIAAGGGRLLERRVSREIHDHPAGGCRMGADPATSVVDPYGRSWDHENLWIVGAPTMPSAGCNNGTLTFAALTLRSAAKLAALLPPSGAEPAIPHRAEVAA